MRDGPESDDLLEEIEVGLTRWRVREIGDGGLSWPTDDADEENTTQDGTTNPVHHEKYGEESSEENANPDGRSLQDVGKAVVWMFGILILIFAAPKADHV
jgi:hypothetical protein